MFDVIKEMTWLRDTVRQSIERVEGMDLKPADAKEIAKRKKILKEIEADLCRLEGCQYANRT
ncbi:conserved hypothetical protein [Mesorhizobium sp. ORS 3324]|nr:conserved hypothetical protein [Mesorhizobium sp. ORS 3324]